MSLAEKIEKARSYPNGASEDFRAQIDRAREFRNAVGVSPEKTVVDRGVDRSRTLDPVSRPRIVRTLAH